MSYCYANPDPIYQPAMRLISSISKANQAAVVTTFDHDYVTGTIVRFVIPKVCGMQQLNGLTGEITVTATNSFTVNIDTSSFDAFAIPVAPGPFDDTCAQVLAIGENNGQLSAAERNILI